MIDDILKKAASPDSSFRGAPFWAWNAELENDELVRQIRCMKEMGYGGFFMHARVGLNTPYLSGEWFDRVKTCVKEAKRLGMKAYLYDEDRWPSGSAGGIVTKNREYSMRRLRCDVMGSIPSDAGKYIACFAGKLEDSAASDVRRIYPGQAVLAKDEKFFGFNVCVDAATSWYNGETYLDVLNGKAVAEFISTTHEAYRKNIGREFGRTVPAIFTDEPSFLNRDGVAWTQALPGKFKKMFGYDILDHLVEIFYRVDGKVFSKTRLDFRNILTTLFVDSFAKQIGGWCGKNNINFTGHVLSEDSLSLQSRFVGSAMRFYEYMQSPGIDLLTEHWAVFDTAKQCSSVAHQFGKKTRVSESYGCTGWDFPFSGYKALGDWQFAMGINMRCPHLAWYSMEAEAKRDFPASIFYQSPWYREYTHVEDYFARLSAILSEGGEQRDLLVIHPLESVWGLITRQGGDESDVAKEDSKLIRLRNILLSANLDFDYGDEDIIARHASVAGRATLKVAKAAYKTVLIPELGTIRRSTLEILRKFAEKGGRVFFTGRAPSMVDGIPSTRADDIFKMFEKVSPSTMVSKLSPSVRLVSIADKNGEEINPALHILRRAASHDVFFVCNYGAELSSRIKDLDRAQMNDIRVIERTKEFPDVTIAMKTRPGYSVYEFGLSDASVRKVRSSNKKGMAVFKTSLPALGSRCFIATDKKLDALPAVYKTVEKQGRKISLPMAGWDYVLSDDNVRILDHAGYSINGKTFTKEEFFIRIDDELRDTLETEHRGGKMTQPWVTKNQAKKTAKTLPLTLRYSFQAETKPSGQCFLAIERPDLYSFELNGKAMKVGDAGFWRDTSIRRVAIPAGYLKKGKNTLILKCSYHKYLPGLESLFLLGNFGVKNDIITALPDSLSAGDWCGQGFANYGGNLTYLIEKSLAPVKGARYSLEIPDWRGAALSVSVNGGEKIFIGWPPYRVDVTKYLKKGKNTFEITVFGHLRNAFGPFYNGELWPYATGPVQFKEYKTSGRGLVPCGLLKPPFLRAAVR